ncbi:MAG TPA: hypothetical protein VFN49_09330 [Candidatus Aquilonibacter sp.]|nr:hypothetical protein [Candidatus Aquilonibacter sp.]
MIKRAAAAMALVGVVAPTAARCDQAGYLYTYGLNESRFGDFVVSADAYKPLGSPNAKIRPFVDVLANWDTKTSGGDLPRIYGDNYAALEGGLQYTTGGLRLFLQGGASAKLGSVAAVHSGGDLRGGAQLYREWGPAVHRDGSSYGNFYGSGVYYSRYQDTIFYNQLEFGRYAGSGAHATELYLRPVLTLDTQRYYYDNLVELTAGMRFHPFGAHGPTFAVEEAYGTYLAPSTVPAGQSKTWFDFRPTISYGVNV